MPLRYGSCGFLRSSVPVYLHDKNFACFTRKLVQNLMSLFIKAKESSEEIPKTKIVQKNSYMHVLETKG